MDRYDRIIRDVQRKTEEELLRWEVVAAGRYSTVLLNPHRVVRAFKAEYFVGGRDYTLLFTEKKIDTHDEFGDSTEVCGFELFILDLDQQVVLSLYEGLVDRDDLLRLSGLIDAHNDRVKTFFEAFGEPGAA